MEDGVSLLHASKIAECQRLRFLLEYSLRIQSGAIPNYWLNHQAVHVDTASLLFH